MLPRFARLLLIAAAAGVLLALVAWLGHRLVLEYQYVVHGVVVTGTVLLPELAEDAAGVSAQPRERRVRYQYQDERGRKHVGEVFLGRSAPSLHPGQPIEVRYLRHSPETSRELSAARLTDSAVGILLACLLLGGLVIGVAVWWTRSDSFASFASWMRRSAGGGWLRSRSRERLLRAPLPDALLTTLRQTLPILDRLTIPERERLLASVKIFVAERRWEACADLVLTDAMKVTVAGLACLLLLGMRHDYFGHVPSILVYPSTFLLPAEDQASGLVREVAALGQAWYRGPVILAWDEVQEDCRNPERGKNVVLHEFAHQLDFLGEGSNLDGPRGRDDRLRWQTVMREEFENLVKAAEQGRSTLLDQYGATNPAEFFAVATECFFEAPLRMQEHHPRLYAVLRDYFGQNPANRATLPESDPWAVQSGEDDD